MNETRQSLLLRAQAGETTAWKELTDLYRPLIRAWLNRQGVPARDLEDLGQEVLLSVVKHLPGFQYSGQCPSLLAAHHRLQPHGRLLAGSRR
jgi:DNA-directed RNA polymerase specialized sigma24 family protein